MTGNGCREGNEGSLTVRGVEAELMVQMLAGGLMLDGSLWKSLPTWITVLEFRRAKERDIIVINS